MSKLNFVNTILGTEDDEYEVDYDLSVVNSELDICINTIDGFIPIESRSTIKDLHAMYNWIERNHNVGEVSDEIKTQRWENFNNNQ